jgi:hypothetical protein
MTDKGKLFVKDLGATGIASLILTLLLAVVAPWIPLLLAMPLNSLAIKIGSWIPQGGGWLEGMADYVLAIHVTACFEFWIASFLLVKLIRMQVARREKRDAEDSVMMQLK